MLIPRRLIVASVIFLMCATTTAFAETPAPSKTGPRRAVYAPRPKYLRESAGKGILELTVDPKTGKVTSAHMLKSTGYRVLDDSAIEAFSRWHFKPGLVTVPHVRVPIEFTNKPLNAPKT